MSTDFALAVQRRSDKLHLYDPAALDVATSDATSLRIVHTGPEVTLSAPALYVKDPLYVDSDFGKKSIQEAVNILRSGDALQAQQISTQAANHTALANTVDTNQNTLLASLSAETDARVQAHAILSETVNANKVQIEADLAAETLQREAAINDQNEQRTLLAGVLRQEQTAAKDALTEQLTDLQNAFDSEKTATSTQRAELEENIASVQASLDAVVGGALDPQKLQDMKEFVTYVNAADGDAAMLIKQLCDYVRELKKVVSSLTGGSSVPVMDKALEAEANRLLNDTQLAELLTVAGQEIYLYSKSIVGTEDVDYDHTQNYVLAGMNSFTPVSAAGGTLAAVHATYQPNTSLLDCDRALVQIKPPLRVQTHNFHFQFLTFNTSEFADSAAGLAFKTVMGLHGQGLVDNLTIKSCVFIGTLDLNAARFKEWSYIDGRTASCTGTIIIQDCCFKNSGGEAAIQIHGPESGFGTLSSVQIKNCHFKSTAGVVAVKGMPLSTFQNAVTNVLIENVTYEHAPHAQSNQQNQSVFEFQGVKNLTMRNVVTKDAEGDLFKTTNMQGHFNVVTCASQASIGAFPPNGFEQVNWTFDNISVQSSSFSSVFHFPSPNPSYVCPVQSQTQVGVRFQNFIENAFVGCEAVVAHTSPAHPDGIYRVLTTGGVETTTPPLYDTDYAHVLAGAFGASRRQMYIAEGASGPSET